MSVLQRRYGWRKPRGDRAYAERKLTVDIPVNMRRVWAARVLRRVKAVDAVAEEGSVRSAGTAMAFSVYETPYISNRLALAKLLPPKQQDEEEVLMEWARGRKVLTVRRPKEMDPMSLNGGTPGRVYILEITGRSQP